jgi:hypothetical protein
MKNTASVGVDLRHIYSSGRRSHHPNGVPGPAKPNPNYRTERLHPPFLPLPDQHAEGEGKVITSPIAFEVARSGSEKPRIGTPIQVYIFYYLVIIHFIAATYSCIFLT